MKALRQTFQADVLTRLAQVLPKLKFLDESGLNLGLTRLFGRAAPGVRIPEGTPGISGQHYTLLGALHLGGLSATALVEGALNREVFEAYLEHGLGPTLQPGDIVVLDNLPAHKGGNIQALVAQRGAQLLYLPPYSADFNPIEWCWAKLKTVLRTAKARTLKALWKALHAAFASIQLTDILGWFAHCGYPVN